MRALALAHAIVAVGCFDRRVHPGSACAANGECPTGLVCANASRTCELPTLEGPGLDGGSSADVTDAATVDAPDSQGPQPGRIELASGMHTFVVPDGVSSIR